jgi:Tol biopolymer transport system component
VRSDGSGRRRLLNDVEAFPSSRPSWSPDSRRIVIGRVLHLGRQEPIWVVDVATGRARMIARSGLFPEWSPNGREIAFASDQRPSGTYVVRPDGSHLRRLVPFSGQPRFSLDGSELAIDAGAVYTVKVDGTHLRQLTHPFDDTGAVGSPDHKKVAFVRSFPPDPRTGEPGLRIVYVVNADGSGLRRVGLGDSVSWAPDSARVAFANGGDIYEAAIDGGAAVKLTSGPEYDSTPAWSPNGATIAFTRRLPGTTPDVCLVAIPESAPPSCLSAGGERPVWSPDGRLIAFTIGDGTVPDARVGVIQPDRGGRRLVGEGYAPAWAPDSRRLAFIDLSKSPDGTLELVNADGTGLTELAGPPEPEQPSWPPDGSLVATTSCPPQFYDCEIWAVPTSTAPSRQLTNNIVDDLAPLWWP